MIQYRSAYDRQFQDVLASYAPAEAVDMLKAIDPLFAAVPCYVICKTPENRHLLPPDLAGSIGWTAIDLSHRCRDYLQAKGEYQGPGFCMIFNEAASGVADPEFLGTVAHEAAHFLEWQKTTAESHGPTWIRATLHAITRANVWLQFRGAQQIDVGYAMPMRLYRRSSADAYRDALGAELHQVAKPIVGHLRSKPPAAFQDLCNQDAQRNGWTLPYQASSSKTRQPARATSTAPDARSKPTRILWWEAGALWQQVNGRRSRVPSL